MISCKFSTHPDHTNQPFVFVHNKASYELTLFPAITVWQTRLKSVDPGLWGLLEQHSDIHIHEEIDASNSVLT